MVGLDVEATESDLGAFWRALIGDSQLRWIGPEKGAIHLATAAVVNAVWDLCAKRAGKPRLAAAGRHDARRSSSTLVDFRYLTDALTPEEALAILEARRARRAERGRRSCWRDGYPAYTTSAGWLGYDDDEGPAALPRGARRRLRRGSR